MRAKFLRFLRTVRWMPLTLVTAGVVTVVLAGSAMAAPSDVGPINSCTSTNALKPLVDLFVDNIVNPIRHFSYTAIGVLIILSAGALMLALSSAPKWVRLCGAAFLAVVLLIPLGMRFIKYHPAGTC